MSLTPFGRVLRQIRIDRGILLYDMAQDLHIDVVRLSRIETGKDHIPDGFLSILRKTYNLSSDESRRLEATVMATNCHILLDPYAYRIPQEGSDSYGLQDIYLIRDPHREGWIVEKGDVRSDTLLSKSSGAWIYMLRSTSTSESDIEDVTFMTFGDALIAAMKRRKDDEEDLSKWKRR